MMSVCIGLMHIHVQSGIPSPPRGRLHGDAVILTNPSTISSPSCPTRDDLPLSLSLPPPSLLPSSLPPPLRLDGGNDNPTQPPQVNTDPPPCVPKRKDRLGGKAPCHHATPPLMTQSCGAGAVAPPFLHEGSKSACAAAADVCCSRPGRGHARRPQGDEGPSRLGTVHALMTSRCVRAMPPSMIL